MRKILAAILALLFPLTLCSPCAAGPLRVKAAILVNLSTGRTLYELNADKRLAPASLTKVMTMFLTLDAIRAGRLKLNDKALVSAEAAKAGGSAMHIFKGERVPVTRLLTGAAVASGNDAATALAEKVGGSVPAFVSKMNSKAASLGMTRTRFKNPTGLPAAGHKTTARDLALLCKAYLKSRPEGRRFHAITNFMHKGLVVRNTNSLLGRVKGVNGLKTGWTAASGYNLIVTGKRGSTELMAVILGAPNKEERAAAAIRLLEAGWKHPNSPALVKKFVDAGK